MLSSALWTFWATFVMLNNVKEQGNFSCSNHNNISVPSRTVFWLEACNPPAASIVWYELWGANYPKQGFFQVEWTRYSHSPRQVRQVERLHSCSHHTMSQSRKDQQGLLSKWMYLDVTELPKIQITAEMRWHYSIVFISFLWLFASKLSDGVEGVEGKFLNTSNVLLNV